MIETYLIGTLMSALPYIAGTIAVTLVWTFIYADWGLWHPVKVFFVLFFASLFYAGIQPSNTYKHQAQRLPNPATQYQKEEMKVTPPLIEQGKVERKEHFEDLVDWKGRANDWVD